MKLSFVLFSHVPQCVHAFAILDEVSDPAIHYRTFSDASTSPHKRTADILPEPPESEKNLFGTALFDELVDFDEDARALLSELNISTSTDRKFLRSSERRSKRLFEELDSEIESQVDGFRKENATVRSSRFRVHFEGG